MRVMVAGCLLTMLIGAAPDLVVLLRWGDMNLAERVAAQRWDRRFDLLTVWPFAIAWAVSLLGGRVVVQLLDHKDEAIPMPSRHDVGRLLRIVLLSAGVAGVLAFGR